MAQNNGNEISGRVTFENQPLPDTINVILLNAITHAVVKTAFTTNTGTYTFFAVKPGSYYIAVINPGYSNYRSNVFKYTQKAFRVPDIFLKSNLAKLREVTVIDSKRFIERQADKIVLNVSRGIITTGTSVLDVLASAPGIKVDGNDALTFRGNQTPLVVIDGKNTHMSLQDVQEMLRNMPSGDVETVELYSTPPPRFDAVGTGGVINIITKKGRNEGFNGSVTAGGGYGNYGKSNAGINFNYRSGRINVFGQASGGENKSNQHINTDRMIRSVAEFDTRYTTYIQLYNPIYRLGADFLIDSTHTFGALFSGFTNIIDYHKYNQSNIYNTTLPDTSLYTTAGMDRRISQANYNINYTGNLGKTRQTLSADISYIKYKRTSDENINSLLTDLSNAANNAESKYRNYAFTNYDIVSVRTDYSAVLGTARLDAGLKASYVKSTNTQQFDKLTGGGYTPNPDFSSSFEYKGHTAAAYGNYSAHNKLNTFNYTAGLRVENRQWTAATAGDAQNAVNRNIINLYPLLQLGVKINNDHRLQLSYNRRTDQPMYEDLNPIVAYQDMYNYRKGNQYLLPAYENAIQLTHIYKEKTYMGLSFSHISNFFNFVYFTQDDDTKVFVTTKKNLKSAVNYTLSFNTSLEVAKWWNTNVDAYISYQRYRDKEDNLTNKAFDAMGKVTSQFLLPKGMGLSLYGQYEVPTDYAIYYYRAYYYFKASFNKKLLHNRATLAFSADDIFNTDRDSYSSNYGNLNMAGYSKKETRRFMVSFTCQFGKSSVKASRKHSSGDDEEQKRIGSAQ